MDSVNGSVVRTSVWGVVFYALGVICLAIALSLLDLPLDNADAHGPRGGGSRGGGRRGFATGIRMHELSEAYKEQRAMEKALDAELEAAGKLSDKPAVRRSTPPPRPRVVFKPSKMLIERVSYLDDQFVDIDKALQELAAKDPAGTLKQYENALRRAKRKKDKEAEADAYQNLGHVYYLTGQAKRAAKNYEDSLTLSRASKDREREAAQLRNFGAALTGLANYAKAQKANTDALGIYTELGDQSAIQKTLANSGVMEKYRGRYAEAAQYLEKALQVDKSANRSKGVILSNLGDLYTRTGEFSKAIETYKQVLALASKVKDRKLEAEAYLDLARVYADWGKNAEALEKARAAMTSLNGANLPKDKFQKFLGELYLDMGMVQNAEPMLKKAGFDSSLGRLYLVRSQADKAESHYKRLLETGEKTGSAEAIFTGSVGLGKIYESKGKYKEAEKYYSKALEASEEIRSALLLSERKNFFAQKVNGFLRSEPAKGLVRVTLKQDKPEKSVYPSEVTRARGFADILAQRVEGDYFNVPAEMLQSELEISDGLSRLKASLDMIPKSVDSNRYRDLERQVRQAESAKRSLVRKMRSEHTDYASVKYPEPVGLNQSPLGPKEFAVLLDVVGDGIAVRLIQGRKVARSHLSQWNAKDLEDHVSKFRGPFERASLADFNPAEAALLYRKLFGAIEDSIPEGAQVTIIPDGILALLPFEALVTGGSAQWRKGDWGEYPAGLSYLGDRNPIVYCQSMTAMRLSRSVNKHKTKEGSRVLVMADPVFEMMDARLQESKPPVTVASKDDDRGAQLMAAIEEESGGSFKLCRLGGTERLAKELESLYSGSCDVYTGMRATKRAFLEKIVPNMGNYNKVVFATHGFAADNLPGFMEPALALTMVPPGTDGFLTMSEIAGLNMDVDVAALTACQTGVGVRLAGEGVMSMGRAFQCAGARSVTMSLWSVSQEASVMLMEQFFKSLNEGKSKLEAWSEARDHIRKQGFEHPFFWAAFVFMGEAS